MNKLRRSLASKPQNYIFFKHSSEIQKVSQIRQKFDIIWTKWSVFSIHTIELIGKLLYNFGR
jgi:hypothetical protein